MEDELTNAVLAAMDLKRLINDIATGTDESDIRSDLIEALPDLQQLVAIAEDVRHTRISEVIERSSLAEEGVQLPRR